MYKREKGRTGKYVANETNEVLDGGMKQVQMIKMGRGERDTEQAFSERKARG